MSADWPILSATIWLPILGGLLVLGSGDKAPNVSRWLALVMSVLTFLVSLLLYTGFDATTSAMQFEESIPWIEAFQVNYHLGIDGISMPLILLTTFITILVVAAGWEVIQYKPSQYMAAFLIMEGVMVGVFSALDAMLFYVFWEAMLIPMFLIIGMSLIAVVYIGFVALVQQDMKKLIAYSSIAHMGFVTLGFYIVFIILNNADATGGAILGMQGGMVQMVSHGFISAAMFLCVGVLYDRMHSRQIADYGGVVNTMPWFAAFMVFFAMANAGLPGTSGFIGEFMVILASFRANFWFAFLAATTLIVGAAYTLWMVKRVVFGDIANDQVAALEDINKREFIILAALAVFVLVLGLWPAPLIEVMDVSIENLVKHIAVSKL